MAIFLAVSALPSTGETVLTCVEVSVPQNLPPGIHQTGGGPYRAMVGPFASHLAAHYLWWLWAKRNVKRLTTELISAAEQAARNEADLLWEIERQAFLVEVGMTPGERADIAAEYDPALPGPLPTCWLFPAQAEAAR